VAEFSILGEEELPMKWKNMARCCPNNLDNDESRDSDDEDEHSENKTKKKSKKMNIDIIREGVYYQNCFNEGHFTKECKLLMKFCRICKASDHYMDKCLSKAMSGSSPSREIMPMHVI